MALAQKGEKNVERVPKTLQDRRQSTISLGRGQGKEHEDEGNRGEKGSEHPDRVFELNNQQNPDHHPTRKKRGIRKDSSRGCNRFGISNQEGQRMARKPTRQPLSPPWRALP